MKSFHDSVRNEATSRPGCNVDENHVPTQSAEVWVRENGAKQKLPILPMF